MVRHYRPKNRFRKWSKLSVQQTAFLMRAFFVPDEIAEIATNAQCSERTVRATFRAINERILTDLACRSALIAYFRPALDPYEWISRNVDLQPDSPFWTDLHSCFFACPAQMEPSILVSNLGRVDGLAHATELEISKGRVTMLRVQCAVCPAKWIFDHTSAAEMVAAKSLMSRWRMTRPRQFREHFFQSVFAAGVRVYAETRMPSQADLRQYTSLVGSSARDLAVILASFLAREPLGKS